MTALDAELAVARARIAELDQALAAARAREDNLAQELQHRVRNMLAVIRSIYRRSRESGASAEEFAEHFHGRLDAIARYHSLVDDQGSPSSDLEDILRNELVEVCCLDSSACTLRGPPVHLRNQEAELMGLAIHELTTNSIKFGALAQDGTLTVEWFVADAAESPTLCFRWTETGVALLTSAPRPSGFGRQLIEEALPYQLGAETLFQFKPGGVECTIRLPLGKSDAGPANRDGLGTDR